jgi:PTH1 family peptidyl-tRNA hydrolase
MVVGLGNPGGKYQDTRHNIGFMAIDRVAEAFGFTLKLGKFDTIQGRGHIGTLPILLAKPTRFMNRSGPPVLRLSQFYKIEPREILVVHDDIDLAFGRLKIKTKGGSGGHNGIRSLMEAFGSGDFPRLRIGVGRPPQREAVTGHVLGEFKVFERQNLTAILSAVQDAILTILTDGIAAGMNRFNGKTFDCST